MRSKAKEVVEESENPGKLESMSGFLSESMCSLRFILCEKENFLFAFLQFVAVGLCYYLWIEALGWIPDDVWDSLKGHDRDSGGLIDLLLIVWGFICIGIAAYPVGIFTSCVCASFILRFSGRQSTVLECLKIAMQRSKTVWVFSWLDGWWTVKRILERLPKKKDRTSIGEKILREVLYQAWKIVSLGFLPALISGRTVKEAGEDSINLLKRRFKNLAKLRFGYSALCWIIGIACYAYMIYYLIFSAHDLVEAMNIKTSGVHKVFIVLGLPMLGYLSVVMLFLRPIYLISACRIYVNYARDYNIKMNLPEKSPSVLSSLFLFGLLCLIAGAIVIFREQLGITGILENSEYFYRLW